VEALTREVVVELSFGVLRERFTGRSGYAVAVRVEDRVAAWL
jgi:hypothetical protein